MRTLIFCHDGKSGTIQQWARWSGMSYSTLQKRLRVMPISEALAMGVHKNGKKPTLAVEYQGETIYLTELAKKVGVKCETLRARIVKGMPVEEAVKKPIRHWSRKTKCTYPDCDRCPYEDCIA